MNVVGGTITASDSDGGDTLTYSLTGTDAGSFEINASGQIKTKTGVNHNFNFEATKNSYSVTVQVRDSKDAAGNANTSVRRHHRGDDQPHQCQRGPDGLTAGVRIR